MPLPLAQFIKGLAESGLIPDDDVRAVEESFPADKLVPEDALELARELIRRRMLTAYQATAIYQGFRV